MRFIDDVFDMGGGYVLDFSDRTFAAFFAEELNIDITEQQYYRDGTSKAKRLRCFLQIVDKATLVQTLKALWEYREGIRQRTNEPDKVVNAHGRFLELLNRIQGTQPAAAPMSPIVPKPAFNRELILQLKESLLTIAALSPQSRGFAYEKFLKKLFDAFGLEARQAFRLHGEQIDGSFQLGHETYLLEAKWQGAPIGAADLHVFEGKIGEKAAWARGLFVSDSGFTAEGIAAFGRGKSLICMSGLDICDLLDREIPLNQVLERKVRHAAETGAPFAQVRDLFT
ncbi:restriction endonuclease [Herbaspirillum rubrisubalbicans]|uniref:DUF3644 domain-containing protein n=1 Tax=Herbaspirillum rubrisubalbicans TaxID=80842 RepID=A0AAD0XGK3_9BURK|nr:restriction endonuclease [Herbaspirillum rubrisubalbicans]AYR23558.1 DUF3644 domain-containing protein [Herbaspirillum rubrisubalbicans]